LNNHKKEKEIETTHNNVLFSDRYKEAKATRNDSINLFDGN
jgi:hypothetical protein